jgi:hypothetical protein
VVDRSSSGRSAKERERERERERGKFKGPSTSVRIRVRLGVRFHARFAYKGFMGLIMFPTQITTVCKHISGKHGPKLNC